MFRHKMSRRDRNFSSVVRGSKALAFLPATEAGLQTRTSISRAPMDTTTSLATDDAFRLFDLFPEVADSIPYLLAAHDGDAVRSIDHLLDEIDLDIPVKKQHVGTRTPEHDNDEYEDGTVLSSPLSRHHVVRACTRQAAVPGSTPVSRREARELDELGLIPLQSVVRFENSALHKKRKASEDVRPRYGSPQFNCHFILKSGLKGFAPGFLP